MQAERGMHETDGMRSEACSDARRTQWRGTHQARRGIALMTVSLALSPRAAVPSTGEAPLQTTTPAGRQALSGLAEAGAARR